MSSLRKAIRPLALAAVYGCCSLSATVRADDPKTDAPKSVPMMGMGSMTAAKPAAPIGDAPAVTGDGKVQADLTLDLHKYDFAGTKANNRFYMPEGVKFSATKPEGVTKEPKYNGTPKYATITIGNGTPSQFTLVMDEAQGEEPKFYLDLNGDGDLTNDQTGDWQTKLPPGKDGGEPSYQGTWTFTPGYKTPSGGNTVGQYAAQFLLAARP